MQTFVSVLRHQASERPAKPVWIYYENGKRETARLTLGELDRQARALAAHLQAQGLEGQRAILLFPPGLDFGVALIACMYAKVIPVPAYPPEPHRLEHTMRRLQSIIEDAATPAVLTSPMILGFAENVIKQTRNETFAKLTWITAEKAAAQAPEDWVDPGIAADDIAFIQYTSGSTSAPKGVLITHANFLANLAMARDAYEMDAETIFACWLPLYHDMGLVGNLLNAVYLGATAHFMPPYAFLKRPLRWLELISATRATVSSAPNFAYDLTVRKVTEAERDTLDLSSMRNMVNGAEPVRAETVERFLAYFGPAGLERSSHAPSFGMAEIGLFATTGHPSQRPIYRTLSRAGLERHRVEAAEPGDADAITLTGSGRAWGDGEVWIVHPQTRQPLPADRVGEVWLRGSHVAAGYWQRADTTAEMFQATLADGTGPFLRTGDLGFKDGDELFITGRRKDLLIIRGRNLYPQDIELTLDRTRADLPEIRPGCAVAASIEVEGEERLVVFQEVEPKNNPAFDPARTLSVIRDAITRDHEISAWQVFLLDKGSLPKTSSGKVMRQTCRKAAESGFQTGGLVVLHTDTLDLPAAPTRPSALAPTGPLDAEALAASARRADSVLEWLTDWLARHAGADPHAPDVILPFGERRLYGLLIPIEHGGLGLSVADAGRVLAALAGPAPALALHLAEQAARGVGPLLFAADERHAPQLAAIARGRRLITIARAGTLSARDGGWHLDATLPPCPGAALAIVSALDGEAAITLLADLATLDRDGAQVRGFVPEQARLPDTSAAVEGLASALTGHVALARAKASFAATVEVASQIRRGDRWLIDTPDVLRALDAALHGINALSTRLDQLADLPPAAMDLVRIEATDLAARLADLHARAANDPTADGLVPARQLQLAGPGNDALRQAIGEAVQAEPGALDAALGDDAAAFKAAIARREPAEIGALAGAALLLATFAGPKLDLEGKRARAGLQQRFDALAAAPVAGGRLPTARVIASLAARFGQRKAAPRPPERPAPAARPAPPPPARRVAPEGDAVARLKTWMIRWIAQEMGMEPAHLERRFTGSSRTPFSSLGIDSVTGIQFVAALEEKLGRTIPTSTLWDFDTIDTLAQHLVGGP